MRSWFLPLVCLLPFSTAVAQTSSTQHAASVQSSDLRYIIVLSRHGVRSPTGKAAQYDRYSTGAWPHWPVEPGYLTPHGFQLMQLFGAYDRVEFAAEGLLQSTGCSDAARITFYADSDQRTRETGKALAAGLMPGCDLPITALPEGTNDPLFHPHPDPQDHAAAAALAKAAIAGRIGDDPSSITQAYRQQIAYLDHILATCGTASPDKPARTSLFDIPATLTTGTGDHLADLKGPLYTASTLSENLLLEYTEGMDTANVGWGCVHRAELESLMQLHAAAVDFSQRTPVIARAQAENLLDVIRLSLQQASSGKSISGAKGKPSDRALFLIGHDTNIENIAGALNLTWIIDGRRDDTPPGGALLFELRQQRSSHRYFVSLYYTAQTLDQMRIAAPLTAANPPTRVAVFIPGCSQSDMSCPLPVFLHLLELMPNP
ncbi:histidine-type phosphatase [Granulicella sp. 5B5]|uniref:histidine-type phosphatase n=1 Tax=Granulicella sp. 5B5 TaxID=1617967 RepID=UPI0015F6C411|nr:histidine-type phosphatase [Granulicella sp. 5B5]QMV19649.1 histidine-type phosphatase [Granulicella sp. 5B5]